MDSQFNAIVQQALVQLTPYMERAAAGATLVCNKGRDAIQRLPREQQLALSGAAGLVGLLGLYALLRPRGSAAALTAGGPDSKTSSKPLRREMGKLSEHEKQLMKDFVYHDDVGTHFEDIGGLGKQIGELEELIILPLSMPHLYSHSSVAQQPTGVLLYGPPGTGKTMLARAIARNARANFLSVNVADVQSKWFGETPKLVEAIFSVARKNAPCVIFVDEVDGVLSSRNESDMAHVNTMKTKFMECWDGLRVANGSVGGTKDGGSDWVLVIGATNKPWALDPAVLRRMPRQIFVGLPDASARSDILRVILAKERVSPGADLARVAALTEGYSGSDLKEVVRAAAIVPIREAIAAERAGRTQGVQATARPIATADLLQALQTVKPTGQAARDYLAFQRNTVTGFAAPGAASAVSPSETAPITPVQRGSIAQAAIGASKGVGYQFGPSASANGINLAGAIEESVKAAAMAAAAAREAELAKSGIGSPETVVGDAESLGESSLEAVM